MFARTSKYRRYSLGVRRSRQYIVVVYKVKSPGGKNVGARPDRTRRRISNEDRDVRSRMYRNTIGDAKNFADRRNKINRGIRVHRSWKRQCTERMVNFTAECCTKILTGPMPVYRTERTISHFPLFN